MTAAAPPPYGCGAAINAPMAVIPIRAIANVIRTLANDIVRGPSQAASGVRQPYSNRYGFRNDMCIFNPAPIT